MKRRKHINREKIINSLELPKDLFLGAPIFTLNGNGELRIENHRGILLYSEEQMVVRSSRFPIHVEGKRLRIESYTAESMIICGKIESIHLTSP